jgi:hypothetical protein
LRHLDPEFPQLTLLVQHDMTERQAEEAADAAIVAIKTYIDAHDAWADRAWSKNAAVREKAWDEGQPPLIPPQGPWFEAYP